MRRDEHTLLLFFSNAIVLPLQTGHVSKVEWENYCSKIDKDLKQLTGVRANIIRIIAFYAVVMVAYYVCVEVYDLLEEYRTTTLVVEVLASLGLLFLVIFLFLLKARCSVIGAIKRHSAALSQDVCPRLKLRCHLPFFQFTGRMASGWYIAVDTKIEDV